jgi:periplasmic divalent cation tolerance protein
LNRIALVRTTLADMATAEQLARTLVEARLAACVTLEPVRSIYRWQGAIADDAEVALLCKTATDRAEALRARIAALHGYGLPVIESWAVECDAAAALWVRDATA